MLIIGERINSTRSHIKEAIKARSALRIVKEAVGQLEAGADFIDVNCAVTSGDEVQDMDWLVSVLQSEVKGIKLSIDSPNYLAIDKALSVYKAEGGVIINSVTAEEGRMSRIIPLATRYNAKLIALTMDEKGMPETSSDRVRIAQKILDRARKEGFPEENLYFDPLARPICTEPKQAKEFLDSLALIKKLGNVKTVCGLSNISFGLPDRTLINSIFLSMAIQNGLDAAILDPLDNKVISGILASRVLMGQDDYCVNYIDAYRKGKLI